MAFIASALPQQAIEKALASCPHQLEMCEARGSGINAEPAHDGRLVGMLPLLAPGRDNECRQARVPCAVTVAMFEAYRLKIQLLVGWRLT
jgi:hypothetical protein